MRAPQILERAREHRGTALVAEEGSLDYPTLLAEARRVAAALLDGRDDLAGERVAFLCPQGLDYVRVQWGAWLAGGVAVPLCPAHPEPELRYVLNDAGPLRVVASAEFTERLTGYCEESGLEVLAPADLLRRAPVRLPDVDEERPAMILYTSGTTSRPKGVVSTHAGIAAQIRSLVEAWEWSPDDRVLLVLPLHHLHGIINVLGCALWTGASCRMEPRFDAVRVWAAIARGDLTLVMAVPTIYGRLIAAWDEAEPRRRARWSREAGRLRLMVSGSAALPVSVLERWREITSHTLLERYGMTETGMILSNPLDGERRAGHVGMPVPGMQVRLVDDEGAVVEGAGEGEVRVRGAAVFDGYWRLEEATSEAFDAEGWFCTGDRAVLDGEAYRLLGRTSVDILKTGGYKVSALEIEERLREHPGIEDCSVVGVEDPEWGDRVCAAVIPRSGVTLEAVAVRDWARERLAPYKVPREFAFVEELPRNALGKVTKPRVREIFPTSGED